MVTSVPGYCDRDGDEGSSSLHDRCMYPRIQFTNSLNTFRLLVNLTPFLACPGVYIDDVFPQNYVGYTDLTLT